MPARMAAIRTADITRIKPNILRPGSLYRIGQVVVDMSGTDRHDGFLIETGHERSTHFELLRMIKSALHVFLEHTLDAHIEEIVETKVVSTLETVNYKAGKIRRHA